MNLNYIPKRDELVRDLCLANAPLIKSAVRRRIDDLVKEALDRQREDIKKDYIKEVLLEYEDKAL